MSSQDGHRSIRAEASMKTLAADYFWQIATGTVATYAFALAVSLSFAIEQSIHG